jgi:hypothetical protein
MYRTNTLRRLFGRRPPGKGFGRCPVRWPPRTAARAHAATRVCGQAEESQRDEWMKQADLVPEDDELSLARLVQARGRSDSTGASATGCRGPAKEGHAGTQAAPSSVLPPQATCTSVPYSGSLFPPRCRTLHHERSQLLDNFMCHIRLRTISDFAYRGNKRASQ